MKTIEYLDIKMSYRLELENIEVPDEVYDELMKCYNKGEKVPSIDENTETANWIADNIHPADYAHERDEPYWEFEIYDIE